MYASATNTRGTGTYIIFIGNMNHKGSAPRAADVARYARARKIKTSTEHEEAEEEAHRLVRLAIW